MASSYKRALFDELGVPDEETPDQGPADPMAAGAGEASMPFNPDTGGGVIPAGGEPGGFAGNLPGPLAGAMPEAAAGPAAPNKTVNLAGWDPTRTDDAGKYQYGRAVQDAIGRGETYNADWVRNFVKQNPNDWEIFDPTGKGMGADPLIRQTQAAVDRGPKRGQPTTWQDVLGDSGGANRPQFGNASGDPALGFAAPETGGGGAALGGVPLSGGPGVGGALLDDALSGDPLAKLQEMIAKLSGSRPNFAALMQQLGAQ